MRLRKIVMVEPRSTGHNVWSFMHLPRLGLPILGTLASRKGYEVRIYIEESTPVDFSDLASADIVCISTITPTAPAAYRLADRIRAMGVPVVIGGPHVSFLPDEALQHADWVLCEGERSFPLFLDMLNEDGDPADVPGLNWRQDGQCRHNPLEIEPVRMHSELPIPDFSLLAGSARDRYHRGVIPVQTSRGCPHDCSFCSVTPMFGRKIRHAPVERVAEELDARRGLGDQVFFYDDNFCAPPGQAKKLLDHLLSRDVFLPAPLAQVSVRAAQDTELLALMQRAGFERVFVGFESISTEALRMYRKRQSVDDIRQAVSRFHRFGIKVHGMFMAGSDAEDVDTISDTARFAIEEGIDSIQFLILTPLPGTPLLDEMDRQGRLLTRDWSLYDTHHAVFRPARMSPYSLMDKTFSAMSSFYSIRRSLSQLARGEIQSGCIGLYAKAQVSRWRRENRTLLAEARRDARFQQCWAGPALAGS